MTNPIIFTDSYKSLTMPKYNSISLPTNSKTYFLIYNQNGVNMELASYGEQLGYYISSDAAIASGAFRTAMMQIKHISKMTIEKFAQVVMNLEIVNDLGLTNSSTPASSELIDAALPLFALGGGGDGKYQTADFFGAMSGVSYNFAKVKTLIQSLTTSELTTTCTALKVFLENAVTTVDDTQLMPLIVAIQTELNLIKTKSPVLTAELNSLWASFGPSLLIEQRARYNALSKIDWTAGITSAGDIQSFVDSIPDYALVTEPKQAAAIIEGISDLTNVAGQSIVAYMRELRNANRLGLTGGDLDNNVPSDTPIETTNKLAIPKVTGDSTVPGSLAGSPEQNLIPANLDIHHITGTIMPSIITVADAVDSTITCNCDCWDLIN